jgi:hypothetical protein
MGTAHCNLGTGHGNRWMATADMGPDRSKGASGPPAAPLGSVAYRPTCGILGLRPSSGSSAAGPPWRSLG